MKKPDTTGAHVAKLAGRILGAEDLMGVIYANTGKAWRIIRPREPKKRRGKK